MVYLYLCVMFSEARKRATKLDSGKQAECVGEEPRHLPGHTGEMK